MADACQLLEPVDLTSYRRELLQVFYGFPHAQEQFARFYGLIFPICFGFALRCVSLQLVGARRGVAHQ